MVLGFVAGAVGGRVIDEQETGELKSGESESKIGEFRGSCSGMNDEDGGKDPPLTNEGWEVESPNEFGW
jgi:hypothetical protein